MNLGRLWAKLNEWTIMKEKVSASAEISPETPAHFGPIIQKRFDLAEINNNTLRKLCKFIKIVKRNGAVKFKRLARIVIRVLP